MKKLNQRGAIDFILIAVVFVLIAGFGGYVYYQQKQNQKIYDQAGSGATVAKKADPTADWTAYENTLGKYSVKYPSTWVKVTCEGEDPYFITYLGPNKDAVAKCNTEYGGQIMLGVNIEFDAFKAPDYKDITTKAVTVDGLSATRVSATVAQDLPYDSVGTKHVLYTVKKGNKTYIAKYQFSPDNKSMSDVESDFDTMVTKTLKFQ